MAYIYLTNEQFIETHKKTIQISGGGLLGLINFGPIESALQHIQNDDYYPSFEDKLTHLFFSVCKFHCFQDGNKRIAISAGAQFLILNGYLYAARRFIHEMENISYHVAADKVSKPFLREIISAIIEDKMDNDELKLRIVEAIQ